MFLGVDLSGTFDTTNALTYMFLWMIFGYLGVMMSCDIQRLVRQNNIVLHLFGLTAFFFLFTLINDTNTSKSVAAIWVKTVFIYALFVLMMKSKWYFVIPVVILLIIDQTFKKHIALNHNESDKRQKKVTEILNIAIIVLIILGATHYWWRQYDEFGDNFSYMKFFFGVSPCKM